VEPIFVLFDVAAAALLVIWLVKLLRPTHQLFHAWRARLAVAVALLIGIGVIAYVLTHWASFDVVDDPYYVIGYASLGLLWLTGATMLQALVADVRLQQDVRDRNNLAAGIALGGLLLANAAAYAGGNVGDGPGWQVVLFSVSLSIGTVTAAMGLIAATSDSEERITIDHDVGAALRFAAVAIATGVIAGRAAAGDWVSMEDTARDFAAVAWPVVPLVVVAVVNERMAPPGYADPNALRSILFVAIVIGMVFAYVDGLGTP
jgi:hypothetical protein